MEKDKLRQVMIDQQENFRKKEDLIDREIELGYYLKGDEIIVISGIRRCGKSSLLKLIAEQVKCDKVFINFDDVRLSDFEISNYQDIEDLSFELHGKDVTFFLDEIQTAPQWQKWVNNLYSKNVKVFVTGSNSNLLSSELSTFLTGRHKQIELQPFSFKEFLKLKRIKCDLGKLSSMQKVELYKSFKEYFDTGGFPLVIRNDDVELSRQYFEDILNKDVINRYKIREVKELKDLALFLFSNVGQRYSYSTLKQVSGIKSLSTIKNYIDYFQNVFVLYKVDRFDYSIKKQKVSSSKIYAGDNSFLRTIAFNFTKNLGRRLENLVYLQLVRQKTDTYYHSAKTECDFVIKKDLKITQAIQVATNLSNPKTKKREVDGLLDAMRKYELEEGLILTLEEEDEINTENYKIVIKPVWKWLLE